MKIEFYDKETGKIIEKQKDYYVDCDGDIFKFNDYGRVFAPSYIRWRIKDENI